MCNNVIYSNYKRKPYFKFEIIINIAFIFEHRKINDNEGFNLHPRRFEQSRQNDYLETVTFVSSSSSNNPTTCVNEVEANRTEVKQDQKVRKPEESTTRPNDKPKIHLYHNVFRKGSYENVWLLSSEYYSVVRRTSGQGIFHLFTLRTWSSYYGL